MEFRIFTDTAGTRVGELTANLRKYIEPRIEDFYKNEKCHIGIVVRCLPDSYHRNSFTRFLTKENDLTIDFCVSVEEYEKLYKIEQKFEIGKTFLEWLDKGLSNKNFMKQNPQLNKVEFIKKVKEFGQEIDWFENEVDYSQDLDY